MTTPFESNVSCVSKLGRMESLHRQIVNPHKLGAVCDQALGGIRRKIGVVRMKLAILFVPKTELRVLKRTRLAPTGTVGLDMTFRNLDYVLGYFNDVRFTQQRIEVQ